MLHGVLFRMPPFFRSKTALVWFVAVLTAARIIALVFSPLELGGDEAQYWAWSQALAFGYFSKPPLIAWVIAFSTAIFDNAEWAVRLSAPLAHAVAALFLLLASKAIGEDKAQKNAGTLAALIYILMPGVWFSSGIMTTDALLLPAIAGALLAYFALLRTPGFGGAIGLGLAIGTGFLAKYAMVYFCLGLVSLGVFDTATRRMLLSRYGAVASGVALVMLLPNLWWNFNHQFATFTHTAQNAEWQHIQLAPLSLLKFWGGQMGIFGLLTLPLLLLAFFWAWRKSVPGNARRLAVFVAIPLLIVSVQALINRANANWAISAFVPATILLALWITVHGYRTVITLALVINFLTGIALAVLVLSPGLPARMGVENAFKRLHGWRETTQVILSLSQSSSVGAPYGALLVDNRLFYYAVKYYGRNEPLPTMYMWPRFANPHTQAELVLPLQAGFKGRILAVSSRRTFRTRMAADFETFLPRGRYSIALGGSKRRRFAVFEAHIYTPLLRDEAYERQWPLDDISW